VLITVSQSPAETHGIPAKCGLCDSFTDAQGSRTIRTTLGSRQGTGKKIMRMHGTANISLTVAFGIHKGSEIPPSPICFTCPSPTRLRPTPEFDAWPCGRVAVVRASRRSRHVSPPVLRTACSTCACCLGTTPVWGGSEGHRRIQAPTNSGLLVSKRALPSYAMRTPIHL
jgi:hypothetical protein